MALSDLAIFSEYAYQTYSETLAQKVDLFNGATNGGLVLRVDAISGSYSDKSFYALLNGIVRRRNPFGDGAVAEKVLTQKIDTIVKVAAGTPPIRMDEAWWDWLKRSPEEPAVVMGQQLAEQMLADMLDVAVGTVTAAMLNTPALVNDISGKAGADALPSPLALGNTAIKIGDRQGALVCWLMHSKSWNDLYANALTNNERLFTYGSVNVGRDPTGRVYVVADNAGLMVAGPPVTFHTLGLQAGAVEITQNDDFNDNWSKTNGNENIKRTYQAEWSYNCGVKGYAYDKANGGPAPANSALFAGASWDPIMTSIKDGPGVVLKSA